MYIYNLIFNKKFQGNSIGIKMSFQPMVLEQLDISEEKNEPQPSPHKASLKWIIDLCVKSKIVKL